MEMKLVSAEHLSVLRRARKTGEGLSIPERMWTNADGKTVRAAGLYQPGSGSLKLKIRDKWIPYQLESLSGKDRQTMKQVSLAAGK